MKEATSAIDLGDLRRMTPVDARLGLGRGKPVDRHYVEDFLARNADDIRGRVAEVGDDRYTREFGGGRVTHADILQLDDSSPRATLIAGLAGGNALPSDRFDCLICTQMLAFVYDVRRALDAVHRMLRPGGVLLATVAGISPLRPHDSWGEYWRFTAQSLARLLGEPFGSANVEVEAYGNVLASTAFLQGLCTDDLHRDELDLRDQRYQLLVAGRAVKRA